MSSASSSPHVDYYRDKYWNDLPDVLAYLCRRSTGRPDLWWMDYFKQKYAQPPFKRGLVLACGNGWVERSLIDRGVVEHFDAFDADQEYLRAAQAEKGTRSIRYFRDSFATFKPDREYDLIVNVAALHHAQRLYRHLARLAGALSPEGVFVNWEYVGPSRNQYADAHVERMAAANEALPLRFRSPHRLRPSLWGAVHGDPTEAVHSAEIVAAVATYFEIVEFKELGGGIAYQILWNNIAEFDKRDAPAVSALSELIRADDDLTRSGAVPNLFAFFVCKRRGRSGAATALRRLAWRGLLEPSRELFARAAVNLYPSELLGAGARALRAHLRRWRAGAG